jgi:hypothetical protein
MRATDVVRERALALAATVRDDDAAIEELIEAAMGRRVAVVMARHSRKRQIRACTGRRSRSR